MLKKYKILFNQKQKIHVIILFAGILITSLLEMVGLGSIPLFISLILNPENIISYLPENNLISFWISKDYLDQVIIASFIILLFFFLKNIFIFLINFLQASIWRDLNIQTCKRLFKTYLFIPYFMHLNLNPAIINRNITREVLIATQYLDSSLIFLREALLIAVIFVLLIIVNPSISLLVFLGIGFFGVVFYYLIKKKMVQLSKLALYHRGRQTQHINQVFGAIKDTKILSREKFFVDEFKSELDGAERVTFFSQVINKIPRLAMEFFGVLAILLVLLFLIYEGRAVDELMPLLAFIGVAIIRLIPSFNTIITTSSLMKRSSVSFNLVIDLLKKFESHSLNKDYKITLNEKNGNFFKKGIKLVNVNFKYSEANNEVLKDINIEIKPGISVAFIGTTGAGKSTLVDLILGLLKPSKGKILIDEEDLEKNFKKWQNQIGYIPQDIYLLDDTIKKNIAFGIHDKDINLSKVERSIKLAQLEKFILSSKDGLDTIVGNRGVRSSGGQRQRIGIARALYNDPKILVLDEATNSLDIQTEKKLMEDIESLKGKYTLIIVTHRLSTIEKCDKIYIIDKGSIYTGENYKEVAEKFKNFNDRISSKK